MISSTRTPSKRARQNASDYPHEAYRDLFDVEDRHFWFIGRNRCIKHLINTTFPLHKNKRFLEVGCGTGYVLRLLQSMGFRVTGLDMHKEALNFARRRTNASLVCSTLEKYRSLHLFDAIGAFDVIEHVDNDNDFIRQCGTKLGTNGWLYLSVPAHMSLWSEYDIISGHKRRYTKDMLQTLLKRNGFRVYDIKYFGFFQFVPHMVAKYVIFKDEASQTDDKLSLTRKLLRIPSVLVNSTLIIINDIELLLSSWISFPFGTSIIVAAQKE